MAKKLWIAVGSTAASWDTAANWSPANEPAAGDDVDIPPGTAPIAGSDQSANELGIVRVLAGQNQALGTDGNGSAAPTYLKLKCTRFEYAGTGKSFIDLHDSAITPRIHDTYAPAAGYCGLYLKGSALSGLSISKGNVGLAALLGETSSVTTALVLGAGAALTLGSGVTITTLDVYAGKAVVRSAGTNLNIWGGEVETQEAGAWTTVTMYGGTLTPNSSGTITTLVGKGGTVDTLKSGVARTCTNLQPFAGFQFRWNKEAFAVTNWQPQETFVISTSRV